MPEFDLDYNKVFTRVKCKEAFYTINGQYANLRGEKHIAYFYPGFTIQF